MNELKLIAIASLVLVSSSAFAAKPVSPLSIGDTGPGGGIVFHVTDDGKHGLEAAPNDQIDKMKWGLLNTPTTAAKSGLFGGSYNTERIISTNGVHTDGTSYAALVAANYNGGGYGDWYLPSKDELDLMYVRMNLIGDLNLNHYWSSTQGPNGPWFVDFRDGTDGEGSYGSTIGVRAVRAF